MKSSRVVFTSPAECFGLKVAALSGNGWGGSHRRGRFLFGHYKKMNVVMARRAVAAKWNSQDEK